MRWRIALIAVVVTLLQLGTPTIAGASQQLGDLDVSFRSLKVNGGTALVTYRTSTGVLKHVYVWGAINANAPNPEVPQVRFEYDYSGGIRRSGRQTWQGFVDRYPGLKARWKHFLETDLLNGQADLPQWTDPWAAPPAAAPSPAPKQEQPEARTGE